MTKATVIPGGFSDATFAFLRALAANNNRAWFAEHRAEYERAVQGPFLQLIAALQAPLAAISPHFVADPRPSGGSMFRLYRDTRFSVDQSPYKTHIAARLAHRRAREREAQTPVFYLQIAPGECRVGGGCLASGFGRRPRRSGNT